MDTKRVVISEAEEILNKYFPVLDYGFVALIDYMGGDVSIERAARASYVVGEEVRDIKQTRSLLRYLFRHKHSSPGEFPEVTIHAAMPIFVMRQWVRHRMSSLNEFSGRYSAMPMLFYTPSKEQVCYQSKDNKQGRSGSVNDDEYVDFTTNMILNRGGDIVNYKQALHAGIANETARIDLPLSTYTYIYWKSDIRNILHLIGLRSDPHAQWETRQYSDTLAGIIQRLCPLTFDAFLDYQMNAVTFSQAEMAAIRYLSHHHVSPISWESPIESVKNDVNRLLEEYGIVGREAKEFWEKLKVKVKRDFSLNLAEAKNPQYFLDIVNNSQVL